MTTVDYLDTTPASPSDLLDDLPAYRASRLAQARWLLAAEAHGRADAGRELRAFFTDEEIETAREMS